MSNIEFLHGWTKDNLNLQGIHWSRNIRETCVVCIHGMTGNIIENYFAEVLGERLSESGFGFIYGHNRGYGHINDIRTNEIEKDCSYKTIRFGQVFERFEECVLDIELWVNKAVELGYKQVILMGHSLGCNKVIHYYSKMKPGALSGIILASPPDMVGLTKIRPEYKKMLEEAQSYVRNNNPREILSLLYDDWAYISAQTYLDLSVDGCSADNLPLLRNPEVFDELSQINIPIFAFMGEFDSIIVRTAEEDLELIKRKAIKCPKFDIEILDSANHVYGNKENELADMILKWLNKQH